jgi:initiation factor 1A
MGKNQFGGNKQKSKKNHIPRQKSVPINEIMPDGKTKFVAKIIKKLGDSRMEVQTLPINETYRALIPGSFKNRIWINTDDYVLIEVCLEMSGANCFITHKYDSSEIDELVSLNILTEEKKEDISDIVFTNDTNEINLDDI